MTPTSTTGTEVRTKGCESVAYEVLTATSTPAVKAYGAGPSGVFIPVRYRLITSAGVESLIDPDTGSGTLAAQDRIIVPNNGYDQIRISTTTGTMTCNATRNFYGGTVLELQKLIDGGLSATVDGTIADDAAFTPATSKVFPMGAFADETSPDSVDEGDAGAVRMTLDRRLLVETTNGTIRQPKIDSYTHAAINLTTGADQVLASSAASKQIWVYGFGISVGDAAGQTVSFQDEDNVALSGIMEFAQYGGMAVNPSGNFAMPIWKLGTDKDLEVDITGGDADGWICYAVVSV